MTFKKAEKKNAKLRLAIYGPSGSGKTFTSLSIASGLGKTIAFIDTERGSASKYADVAEFDVLDLDNPTIENYVKAIKEADGYDVLIIDSLSHAWQELLAMVDKLAITKYKGNSFSAWSEGTPLQRELVDTILSFKGHLIATMRSAMEYTIEKDEKTGRSRPSKVGLKPEQGKNIEYEFDMLMEVDPTHHVTITKDRTGKFQDQIILKPGKEFGEQLQEWLNSGKAEVKEEVDPTLKETMDSIETIDELNEFVSAMPELNLNEFNKKYARDRLSPITEKLSCSYDAKSKKFVEKVVKENN
jgi:ABC-type dipeptide/oligopeptide/nickel transport system ATPase component